MHKLVAYKIHANDSAPLRSARRDRRWIEETDQKFAYRCLPLLIANQYGWEIISTHHIRAAWDGTSHLQAPEAGTGFYELIEPRFNRLTVFDDRLIHGVECPQGSMDPVDGRCVLHGHIEESGPI